MLLATAHGIATRASWLEDFELLDCHPMAEAMNQTSAAVAPEVDEFALAGLTPVSSRLISVPRVGESPVSFECRLTQLIQLKTVGGDAMQTWLTLGQVVGVHISDSQLKGGVYDTAAARPILRGGDADDELLSF